MSTLNGNGLPAEYPLSVYRGDSRIWQFRLWEDAAANTPYPVPAGTTASAQIRGSVGGSVLLALACHVTPPNVITVQIQSSDWATFTAGGGIWDLQVTYPDGPPATVFTVVKGSVSVHGDVTRP